MLDAGMLMGGGVIHNEVEIPVRRGLSVKRLEEPQPLWVRCVGRQVPMRGPVRSSRAAKSVGVPCRSYSCVRGPRRIGRRGSLPAGALYVPICLRHETRVDRIPDRPFREPNHGDRPRGGRLRPEEADRPSLRAGLPIAARHPGEAWQGWAQAREARQ